MSPDQVASALMGIMVALRIRCSTRTMTFTLASPAFADGARIPERHTCDGENLSPPLSWADAPAETKSFALICEDPDAPAGIWHHWALFDLPSEFQSLAEGYPTEAVVERARQARNDFRRFGYGGPCPPKGHGTHHYHFRLLALSAAVLDPGPSPDCEDVARTARPHVLAEAQITGTYDR